MEDNNGYYMEVNKHSFYELTYKFMHNLKVGDSFDLLDENYSVKCFGKYNTDIKGVNKSFKTLTLKTPDGQIKFYFFFGIHGNPKSVGTVKINSNIKPYRFLRNIEGQIIVDLLNINNPLHDMSEIYKISKRKWVD